MLRAQGSGLGLVVTIEMPDFGDKETAPREALR